MGAGRQAEGSDYSLLRDATSWLGSALWSGKRGDQLAGVRITVRQETPAGELTIASQIRR